MGNNSSKGQITDQDRAVLDLKLQRDKIRQYQKRISVVLDREHEVAKECLSRGDKRRALLALRKRKYQDQLLAKTDAQLDSLEELTRSIEFALVQKDVLYGLQQGSEVLKAIHKEMSLETVERIMDASAEGIAYQNEISELLSSRITNWEEEEVQLELEELERQELEKKQPVALPKLPDAPSTELRSQNEEQEGVAQKHVEQPTLMLA